MGARYLAVKRVTETSIFIRTYEKLSVQGTFANTLYASMPLSKAIHGFRRFAKVPWTLSFS
jgi:hypothetical protein